MQQIIVVVVIALVLWIFTNEDEIRKFASDLQENTNPAKYWRIYFTLAPVVVIALLILAYWTTTLK